MVRIQGIVTNIAADAYLKMRCTDYKDGRYTFLLLYLDGVMTIVNMLHENSKREGYVC